MLSLLLPMIFQIPSLGGVLVKETPPVEVAIAGETAEAAPKPACTMEPITGTKARKMKVCKTPAYEENAERSRGIVSGVTKGSGDVQAPPPPVVGKRPGFSGY
jgi:hypothetical protein